MKSLLDLIKGKLSRKDIVPLTVARMQTLAVLQIYLEHAVGMPVTITQADLAFTAVEDDAAGVHFDTFVEAIFYHDGMDLPPEDLPKVTVEIRFRSDTRDHHEWRTRKWHALKVQGTMENIELPETDEFVFLGTLFRKLDRFERRFNAFRPTRTSIDTR